MTPPLPAPWRITAEGLSITARLTPRGGRDALDGIETMADGRTVLKLRVRAAPTEGEANAALILLLAKTLKLSKSSVSLTAGASARIKTVQIKGDGAALSALLTSLTTPSQDKTTQ